MVTGLPRFPEEQFLTSRTVLLLLLKLFDLACTFDVAKEAAGGFFRPRLTGRGFGGFIAVFFVLRPFLELAVPHEGSREDRVECSV